MSNRNPRKKKKKLTEIDRLRAALVSNKLEDKKTATRKVSTALHTTLSNLS